MPDPERAAQAAEQLGQVLGLHNIGRKVTGARIVGNGSRASCDLYLDDGTGIMFESIAAIANPTRLTLEVVTCTGAIPKKMKAPEAVELIALIRDLAQHEYSLTIDQIAIEWGRSYLQNADIVDCDMNDQAQRWAAFCRLSRLEPHAAAAGHVGYAVIRDRDGTRLVRTGWFQSHVRSDDSSVSPQDLSQRMARVGWLRSGRSGRIKATNPGFVETLGWNFYRVPGLWENAR